MDKHVADLLELANQYPSPHNGQPIRVRQTGSDSFDLYFARERGLQATDISYIFSFVSMGVFVEHLSLSAQALGHTLTYTLTLPSEADLHGTGPVRFGSCQVGWGKAKPDEQLHRTLQARQTSRKKYFAGPSQELIETCVRVAGDSGMALTELSPKQTQQAIWLNQRAVFDDMFDAAVRRELNHWLRYSQAEKQTKRDGLSYDCMELNGQAMKFSVDHPGILRAPILSWLIKQYYLHTIADSSRVCYLLAPFDNERASFNVGLTIMKLWREVAQAGYYLHPFGTIMSNHAAHRDFVRMVGIQNESRGHSYLTFIFRCGKSQPPVRSLRLPYTEHLMME